MNREHIPTTLKHLDQWVCWRYESHPSRSKPTKVPYCATTGERASVQEPQTWDEFDVAYQYYQQDDRYNGIGLVLTCSDRIIGVDVDDCMDDTGDLQPVAQEIVALVDSYSEISPS
jgi:putative DNA primase/helicase